MRLFSDLNRIESVLPNRGVGVVVVVDGCGCGGVLCHCRIFPNFNANKYFIVFGFL